MLFSGHCITRDEKQLCLYICKYSKSLKKLRQQLQFSHFIALTFQNIDLNVPSHHFASVSVILLDARV